VEEIKRRELQRQRQEVKRIFEAELCPWEVDEDVNWKNLSCKNMLDVPLTMGWIFTS
jgi:hypothetical protein